MRVVVVTGMALLLAAGGTTAGGAPGGARGKSAVTVDGGITAFKVGNFNRDDTSSTDPSPCFKITFGFTPDAPVYHADVTQVADLPTDFKGRSPNVGEPHREGGPVFEDATIPMDGASFTQQYCRFRVEHDRYTITVKVKGLDRQGGLVFRTFILEVKKDAPDATRASDNDSPGPTGYKWLVHCLNC